MFEIEKSSGQVVAADTQKSVDALDQAVMSMAHLCASIVEVSRASRLPVSTPQPALANAGESLSKLIAGREDISHAVRELIAIQRTSSLQAVSFGCPDGLPQAQAQRSEPAVEADAA
ncbi:hypothetical protein [Qipengyuania huizhouensis]|uniref:hypothetical protein n=1 Tax=Qipengyuania huizhouensis TaxID=2867245 RepID=UPI0017A7905C|nr:hypothetical protein [Qipengyuania huizhouensis]MBA4765380.1 hypothetical protein [Erythrobacter sp.]MBX7459793.1 hypothetical protein [Qipengyuania huizhouensis]